MSISGIVYAQSWSLSIPFMAHSSSAALRSTLWSFLIQIVPKYDSSITIGNTPARRSGQHPIPIYIDSKDVSRYNGMNRERVANSICLFSGGLRSSELAQACFQLFMRFKSENASSFKRLSQSQRQQVLRWVGIG